ncbi:hypothetical protein [Oceanisphaera sp. IT1-181]|uniref:hypothetical protein n=1 Tax=Oceanisphaera sp. IT1-181 TaxID=3081199 RepID=UPI0029CA1FCF|nr:hypothetical protein [Oceanisphaera sp. IT1-181]
MNKDNIMKAASQSVTYTTAALLFVSLNVAAANLHQDINRIESNSLNNISGIIGVNTAAGDNNIQANNKSIAIGQQAQAISKSKMYTEGLNHNGVASVRIEANTLHNAHGLISVNQVSGSHNIQLNDISIAFGEHAQVLSDMSLSTRPTNSLNLIDEDSVGDKTFYLDNNSLKGASGAIQINQIAGNGNIVVNRVSMPIQ